MPTEHNNQKPAPVRRARLRPTPAQELAQLLKPIFAEALLVRGLGDSEQLASLLSPADFQRLSERVDLDFLPTNPQLLAPAPLGRLDPPLQAPQLLDHCTQERLIISGLRRGQPVD